MAGIDVLFVCTANICRSPFMELYAAARLPEGASIRLGSAGTHGFRDHPMDATMAAELTRRDIDVSGFRSRRLTRDHLDAVDLVLTAERSHRTFIVEEHPAVFRKVFTLGQFVDALAAEDGVESMADLVGRLVSDGVRPHGSIDVVDPYARGPRAAAACAVQLAGLLDTVLAKMQDC